MFEKNTPKIVKIKLEPQDHEIREEIELPTKRFKLPAKLNDKAQETLGIADKTQECELEKRLKSLEQSNNQQQETIKSLTTTCNDVAVKNQALERSMQELQEENKQLKENIERQTISISNYAKELNDKLKNALSEQTTALTSKFNEHSNNIRQQEAGFQASLTQTEKQHHQQLLMQFNAFKTELSSTIDKLKLAYNQHRHPYTDRTYYARNQVDDHRITSEPQPLI